MEIYFLSRIFDAMLCMATTDGELHQDEVSILRDFREKYKLSEHCTLPKEGLVEDLSIERLIDIVSGICEECDTDAKKLFLLDRLSQIADADLRLNENEIKLLEKIHEIWGIGIAFTKQQIEWSDEQKEIINLDPSQRIIVSAPPGSGKTAVVVAKLDKMIRDYSIEASNIWIISFTRTAVREMNDRVNLEECLLPRGLKIATLDSTVFSLNFPIHGEPADLGNYDSNIYTFLDLIRTRNSDLIDFLSNLEHVIIDESQDLIGDRRDVCAELIKLLEPDCGVTILGDEYQQIYGKWANSGKNDVINLMDFLKTEGSLNFKYKKLTKIHRTDSRELINLIETLRLDLSVIASADNEDYQRRRKLILDSVDKADSISKNEELSENHLVLFRNRTDVVEACWSLIRKDARFKLRLPQYPRYISPWVHKLFEYANSNDLKSLSKSCVLAVVNSLSLRDGKYLNKDLCWETLMRYSASDDGDVSVNRLREILGNRQRPPVEFTNPEFGYSGPVLSTVHASKGRESKSVIFNLPTEKSLKSKDYDEESRVLLVGASRARDKLQVGSVSSVLTKWEYTKRYERYFRVFSNPQFKNSLLMEIGLEGDYDPYSCVSQTIGYSEVQRTQGFLRGHYPLSDTTICIARRKPNSLIYNIEATWQGQTYQLGQFSPTVHDALVSSSKRLYKTSRQAPLVIPHIKIVDVACFVCARDDEQAKNVLTPFQKQGAWLYPVLFGIGPIQAANF